jgi:hypothetical protein
MAVQAGNLSSAERGSSALFGIALSVLAIGRGSLLVRTLSALAGASLLARAFAGHCGVKAAINGHSTLREGLSDQWNQMRRRASSASHGLPGSPVHASKSHAVDESVVESFPASDAPASRLPDEPPVNAEDKWAAARAAEVRGRGDGGRGGGGLG